MRLLVSILICIAAAAYTQRHSFLPYISTALSRATTSTNQTLQHTQSNATMSSAAKPSSTFVGLPVIPPNDPSLNAKDPKSRGIKKFFEAVDTPEGAGARVRRSIGTRELKNFTPFLMLDHFSVSPGAGFPDHPHRGQETITYLMSGAVDHEDFAGNKGTLETVRLLVSLQLSTCRY